MIKTSRVVGGVLVGVLLAGPAGASEQTILGNRLKITDPGVATKRKIVASASERDSLNTVTGPPTASGAVLGITTTGGNPTGQTFFLPGAFWGARGFTGWKYKDPSGLNGPVKSLMYRKSASGKFVIKLTLIAKNGPIDVVPPNPGTGGCVALEIVGADRYSVAFGPESQVSNKGTRLFKAKGPTVESICPVGVPTTTTTSTSTSTTTSTTIGSASPSFVFLDGGGLF